MQVAPITAIQEVETWWIDSRKKRIMQKVRIVPDLYLEWIDERKG